jgi:ubiquinone biosynthesis protein UbiJ
MNSSSPFSFLESFVKQLQPPPWLVAEGQQRLVLLLNHVLMQEKEAQSRLARKKGSVVRAQWAGFSLDLLITPAGLTDLAPAGMPADLKLIIVEQAPWTLAQSVLQGKAPAVKIEGDVMLAAELGWLADNLRWDIEEDLARVLGDVPAHALAQAARRVLQALRPLLARAVPPGQGLGAGT